MERDADTDRLERREDNACKIERDLETRQWESEGCLETEWEVLLDVSGSLDGDWEGLGQQGRLGALESERITILSKVLGRHREGSLH